ncbi:MAG: 16S rRNA (cytosine(967)-C(5))-methyltransferase RsmB [Oscillospiraceae bacterium]|jgi:16S rRNA (cytosine967-C5)-methyltransferase|nr:16S rRNA (cytosine(967)-C(5))-methyltransferase RsmB [Oscillospiraceae bacterium]
MGDARRTAFDILNRVERDGAYSNLLLKETLAGSDLDARDAAFAHSLVSGVLERLYTLDYLLSLCLKQPLKKLKPQVLTILRMGAFQMLFMEKVPASAAVNESVGLAKKSGSAFAAGLVNAVLRSVHKNGVVCPNKDENSLEYYKVRYSYPIETVRMFIDSYGEPTAESIMESSLGRPFTYGSLNTLKTDFDGLRAVLPGTGAEIEPMVFPETAFALSYQGNVAELNTFRQGLFYVQDLSSQICAAAVAPQPGHTVLDVCAAPGGKSFHLAIAMQNKGQVIACDIHEHKIRLLEEGARRLGVEILHARLRDALSETDVLPESDRVLCDVPCSGFGVAGRKPEIKYKPLGAIAELPALQLAILKNSARFVKTGGILTYSTCTLNPAENDGVCERFLQESPLFRQVCTLPQLPNRPEGKSLTIFPHMFHSDGFFIAQFERMG